ncbi:MAG TPA: BBE domain-containing protein [Terriglobales bacterium]|nr:BBE domain-containing protein [Terriglobales bacterium]
MIDLSRMKTVRVDPAHHVAQADPGLLLAEFDHETQAFGMATTLGTFSVTGISGLTLGGGLGWLMGKHGLACDNLISVDVVTADGELLRANTEENSDLFWGLRGGSGNFGVATRLEFQLHPVGPLFAGLVAFPISQAADVLRFYLDYSATAPDELGLMAALITLPDGNTVVGVEGCYNGPVEKGERVLHPLRSFGPPAIDLFQMMPYTAVQKMNDWWAIPGQQHYWKSGFLRELNDAAIHTIAEFAMRKPSLGSAVALEFIHGAARRIAPDATAFAHRDAQYNFLMLGRWESPAETETGMRWVREFWSAMQPFLSAGVYVNYLSENEGGDRVRSAYGMNYERLVQVKAKYDPTNFFCMNHNIRTANAAAL